MSRKFGEPVPFDAELAKAVEVAAGRSLFPRPTFSAGDRCRVCGCTENRACPGGCWWVEQELCSRCVR